MRIRPATADDLVVINDIYNHYVEHSTCTYQVVAETLLDRRRWFARQGALHPVIVMEDAGQVVGWGSLMPFNTREAYRRTVEDSIYIHHAYHRRGIGRALLNELIASAKSLGHHTMLAKIDAEQDGSLKLHEQAGFVEAGRMMQVGFKFERWLDVVILQKML